MERERLRPNQDMDMAAMEDMVMGDLMEVMVDTEAMEVMVMEREMLSQVMGMVDMVMEDLMVVTEATDMVMGDLMEVMVDTEAMEVMERKIGGRTRIWIWQLWRIWLR